MVDLSQERMRELYTDYRGAAFDNSPQGLQASLDFLLDVFGPDIRHLNRQRLQQTQGGVYDAQQQTQMLQRQLPHMARYYREFLEKNLEPEQMTLFDDATLDSLVTVPPYDPDRGWDEQGHPKSGRWRK